MTDQQARKLFDSVTKRLHAAGWDVLATISRQTQEGNDSVHRALLHGSPGRQCVVHTRLACQALKLSMEPARCGDLPKCDPVPGPCLLSEASATPAEKKPAQDTIPGEDD